jgi:membrane protein implicated in regulation of membrane protease activity
MPGDEACIGSVGVLTVATRGEAGPGEVRIKIRGGTEVYRAWSEEPLPRGATVLVVASRGGRTLDVVEWEDLLGDGPSLTPDTPTNKEM